MKRVLIGLVAGVAACAIGLAVAEQESEKVDEETKEVLRKINSVSPYQVPDLDVRKDQNYAHTPEDVEPFGPVKPHKEYFLQQMEYTGPGRAIPEPADVETVKLGFIGPIQATVSVATGGKSHEEVLGTQMLRGTRLAIEEANAKGGYVKRGIPFELVVSNDNGLWGASGNEIVNMAYKDRVWAILGTIDGANSHIAIRVALKAEILMINTGDTDPTFVETNIPWVVRVIGDDRQQSYLLVDYLYRKHEYRRVGVIRASNRYGRFGVREIRDSSRRLGHPIVLEMAYQVGSGDYSLELERLRDADVDAIVHWGDAEDAALILNQMRDMNMNQPYFTSDRSVSDEFVEIAGDNAEGVIAAFPWNPSRKDEKLDQFRERFRERFGVEADTYAAHAYDGMNMLIWAVQTAGLNRAKIRDMLATRTKAWPGVTGDIVLSAVLDDVGDVYLARFEKGKWVYYSREDLEIPRGYIPPRDRVSRGEGSDPAPYFDAKAHSREYAGPGREEPAPDDLREVRIGYFGPSDPEHPAGGDLWLAAQLAIDEANEAGGYRGLDYRLVPAWSENRWGTGVARVARITYGDRVWAIIGSIDGAATHLAEQVVAKARLTLLNPGGTDKTVNMANVPWVFSCLPADDRQAAVLARALAGPDQFTLISATDHDSHVAAVELRKALDRLGIAPSYDLEFEIGTGDRAALVERVVTSEVEQVVILADPEESARLLQALRRADPAVRVLGGPAMGRRIFLEEAGATADGVLFPQLCDPAASSSSFTQAFLARYGRLPDCVAVQTYDAVRLLIEAIETAGLNRARIRDAVEALSPWTGSSGAIRWDVLGQNQRDVRLATVRDGRVVPVR